ncbi:GPP34 family phosphoprotein [Streptomyces flaveolus]|uniref:GPP34 family phosphoprotein n=1 Tax=Streptomyces flaveolus TaxID=67297 RepID=UPI0033A533D2
MTHPVTAGEELTALRGRLASAVAHGQAADERIAAVIAVLHHAGLLAVLRHHLGEEELKARLASAAEQQASAAELGDTIRTTVAALTAVIAVSAL